MLLKHLGFGLNIIAIGLFVPGIYLTMFSFDSSMSALISGSALSAELVNKELSIIATVEELYKDERLLVAALIFIFSILIPILKTSIITLAYFIKNQTISNKLVAFVSTIGKWSMADVFVVAIFLAILSTNHADTATSQELSVFGFKIALEISTQTLSAAGKGFYYFAGYCVLSLLGSQLLLTGLSKRKAPQAREMAS